MSWPPRIVHSIERWIESPLRECGGRRRYGTGAHLVIPIGSGRADIVLGAGG